MDIGRLGVWTFQLGTAPDDELRSTVAELEELGYGTIWYPFGAADTARRLLEASSRIVVATGIRPIWLQDAATLAAEVKSLRADFPDRFLLGLGVSHPEAINRDGSERYRKPITAMRRFLDDFEREAGADVLRDTVVAALRTRMLEIARTRVRGAHPYFVPVEHTSRARNTLGPDALLAPEQAIAIETDPDAAKTIARGHMAGYLRLQNYTNNLRDLGYTDDDIRDGGSDRLVDAIVASGDAATVAARIRAHWEAGADHVCVQALESDFRAVPLGQWRALAGALGS